MIEDEAKPSPSTLLRLEREAKAIVDGAHYPVSLREIKKDQILSLLESEWRDAFSLNMPEGKATELSLALCVAAKEQSANPLSRPLWDRFFFYPENESIRITLVALSFIVSTFQQAQTITIDFWIPVLLLGFLLAICVTTRFIKTPLFGNSIGEIVRRKKAHVALLILAVWCVIGDLNMTILATPSMLFVIKSTPLAVSIVPILSTCILILRPFVYVVIFLQLKIVDEIEVRRRFARVSAGLENMAAEEIFRRRGKRVGDN